MFEKVILIIILIVLVLYIISKFYGWENVFKNIFPVLIIDPNEAVIIHNRFGKNYFLKEGIHFYIPGIHSVYKKNISLKEKKIDPPQHDILTNDDINLIVDMVGYYKITNPLKAIVEVKDYEDSLKSLIASETLESLGGEDFDTIQKTQDNIEKQILKNIKETTDRWGLKVIKLDFKKIGRPDSIKNAMEKKAEEKINAEAKELNAKGEYEARRLQALSEKILIEKKAEALHMAIKQFKELMPDIEDEKIMQFLTSNAHIDSIKTLSSSEGTKFVLYPTDTGQPMDKLTASEFITRTNDKKDRD